MAFERLGVTNIQLISSIPKICHTEFCYIFVLQCEHPYYKCRMDNYYSGGNAIPYFIVLLLPLFPVMEDAFGDSFS